MNSVEEDEMIKTLFLQQHGFLISKIMLAACELGVFDLLLESKELLSSAVIAERLGTSHIGMQMLLEACAGLKLLTMERKDNEGYYRNTNVANLCLAKSSPKSQYQFMKLQMELGFLNWQSLTKAVREGKCQLQYIFGTSEEDNYKNFYRSEEELQKFSAAMADTWSLYGEEVMTAFDLSRFHVVCDLGGCSGYFAKKYISFYPNSTVTVFDLPEVVERGKKDFVPSEEHQITFQSGDFFNDPVPEADLNILARILHGWGDEKCVALLSKLYKACKPGGGVLIVESVLNEDRRGPLPAHFYSLVMFVCCEGKERTLSEYNALLGAAGFKDVQLKKRRIFDAVYGSK